MAEMVIKLLVTVYTHLIVLVEVAVATQLYQVNHIKCSSVDSLINFKWRKQISS